MNRVINADYKNDKMKSCINIIYNEKNKTLNNVLFHKIVQKVKTMGLWDFEDFWRSFAKSGKIKKENVGPFFEKEHRSKFPFVCFSNAESKNEKNDIGIRP